jgi:hypothetical protein
MKYVGIALLTCITIGCSAPQANQSSRPGPSTGVNRPVYSKDEAGSLSLCQSMSDNAWTIASRKLAGRSAEDVKIEYRGRPASELTIPMIDKVYEDQFSNSWDYVVSFYRECALNMADLPEKRSDMAAYCMQNSMIASIAKEFKSGNAPREKAYQYFEKMPNSAKMIVDEVYAQSQTRNEIVRSVWQSCMDPISEK